MLGPVRDVIAGVILVLAALLACVIVPLQAGTLSRVAKGDVYAGSDPAGYVMGRGYLSIAALAGALCAAIVLLMSRPLRAWAACVLGAHVLTIVLGSIEQRRHNHAVRRRMAAAPDLATCPKCGVGVRADRLSKHVRRVHGGGSRD